jgi:polysaccharide export outer membrane protein
MRLSTLSSLALVISTALLSGTPAFAQKKEKVVNEGKKTIEDLKTQSPASVAAVDPRSYKLGSEDIIFIRVWREADLTGPVMVRPDGKITMPLIGEIQAAGQTPEELGKLVTEALSKVMQRPEVFISVQQVNSRKYYISGEVAKTGVFPIVSPVTILEALSIAGGLREYANGKKITIVRGTERIKFNYKEVIEGKNLKQNIMLQSGDHIIVP